MTYDVARFWGAINRWVRRLWRSAVAGTGDLKFGLLVLLLLHFDYPARGDQ